VSIHLNGLSLLLLLFKRFYFYSTTREDNGDSRECIMASFFSFCFFVVVSSPSLTLCWFCNEVSCFSILFFVLSSHFGGQKKKKNEVVKADQGPLMNKGRRNARKGRERGDAVGLGNKSAAC
jgi:hypothetical protein